ncbi:MAG: hypothetical protein AAGG01_05485 [Planctomycetota bacterium]
MATENPDAPRKSLTPEALAARREALLADVRGRIARAEGFQSGRRRQVSLSGIRLRTLLLPAFAIVLFLHFGSRAGAPLGVHAAFTPGSGASFAGPRVFDDAARSGDPATGDPAEPVESVRLEPGDVVGTTSGSPSTLELGRGRLVLEPGARAAVASLMPPRVRFLGGRASAEGRLRIVTAHGIYDLHEGRAELALDATSGLVIEQRSGEGEIVSAAGSRELSAGDSSRTQ